MTFWRASKRKPLPAITDYHTHILPGVDDGARNKEESLTLLGVAQKYGVNKMYATPHFYGHRTDVQTFCEKRGNALASLKDSCPAVQIRLGAEILVFPGLERLDHLEQLVLEDTRSLLVEMPLSNSLITEQHFFTVEQLSKRFQLIMAHANRYADSVVEQMLEFGVILQVNGRDLLDRRQRKRVLRWQQQGAEVILGSDVHRNEKSLTCLAKVCRYILPTQII